MIHELVVLAVETDLGKGARLNQRAHAEQSLIPPDGNDGAKTSGGHFADFYRTAKSVGPERVDVGNGGRFVDLAAQMIIDDQLIARAVELGLGFARLRVRQQVARDVGPKAVK